MMFRMNCHDFKNCQIKYGDTIYPLYNKAGNYKNNRTKILFLLNVHREVFVKLEDIIGFVYGDVAVEDWPDYQSSCVRAAITALKKMLPQDVVITNSRSFGYMLNVQENSDG